MRVKNAKFKPSFQRREDTVLSVIRTKQRMASKVPKLSVSQAMANMWYARQLALQKYVKVV